MTGPPVDAACEEVVEIPAPDGTLVGVFTRPPSGASRPAVLLCPGGWYGTSTNRNRLVVRLARRLAGEGHPVLRFDWHGVGESDGELGHFRLDAPFAEDVLAAAGALADRAPCAALLLVGVCFGSRSAFAAAPALPGLRGIALVSFPVPDGELRTQHTARRLGSGRALRLALRPEVLRGLADPQLRRAYAKALRVSGRALRTRLGVGGPATVPITTLTPGTVLDGLRVLDERDVSTYLLFGEEDFQYEAFGRFRSGPLDAFLAQTARVRVEAIPGDVSGFASIAVQEAVSDRLVAWAGAVGA